VQQLRLFFNENSLKKRQNKDRINKKQDKPISHPIIVCRAKKPATSSGGGAINEGP
jgi:hypothetical protein